MVQPESVNLESSFCDNENNHTTRVASLIEEVSSTDNTAAGAQCELTRRTTILERGYSKPGREFLSFLTGESSRSKSIMAESSECTKLEVPSLKTK